MLYMKTSKPELEVPEAAVEKLKRIASFGPYEYGEEFSAQPVIDTLAIATPVVVAELRAQAALIRRSAKYGPSDAWMTHKLERRADELEAGA